MCIRDRAEEEAPKKGLFKKSEDKAPEPEAPKKAAKKADEKPKKKRFQFLRDVKSEMKLSLIHI